MNAIRTRSVEEIAEVLQDLKNRTRSCSLLIGAGASFAAGVPTAAGFVEIIKQRYPRAYARTAAKTYANCMAQLMISQRRDLIAEYVDKARINWAHIGIALLMQKGFIDRVLTTNFDPLVVRACALLGLYPAVYDFATSQLLKNADIPGQAVFYLHGQRTGFVLMNTDEDMTAHSKLLKPVFEDAANGRAWIVVGYSGENDPVFENLASQSKFDNGLFWVGYQDREPQRHVSERLLTEGNDAFYVKGYDADSFFVSLTRALQIFPPDVIRKPFSFVRSALDQLTPFVHPGQSGEEDVMRIPNEWIQKAIAQFEPPDWKIFHEGHAVPGGSNDRSLIVNAVQYISLQGDYGRVIEFKTEYERDPSPQLGDIISNAYVMQANRLLDRAKMQTPAAALESFKLAKPMYEAALKIKPSRHEAHHNWGNFLLDLAKTTTGPQASEWFQEAETHFEAAAAIKPDQPEILINWGNLLLDRAKAQTGAGINPLFKRAEEKFNAALAINPNMPNVRHSLGNLSLDQAKTLSGHAAEVMFANAENQYKLAIDLNPQMAEAFYQWGNVYLDRAKRGLGGSADAQFTEGIEKFRSALAIRPDLYQALNNWASLLVDFGKTKNGEEANALFEEADKRYSEATRMQPGHYAAWNNWGNLLLDWGKSKDEAHAEALFATAEEKFREAHSLRPDQAEPLNNWGNLLLDRAKLNGANADHFFKAAQQKYSEAFKLRPSMFQILNNWGNCVADQGRRKSGIEAQRLFAQAKNLYVSALAMSPEDDDIRRHLVSLLMDSKQSATVDEAMDEIARSLLNVPPLEATFLS